MRILASVWLGLFGLAPAARAAGPVTCIEQEVVRERVEGQPALRGEQRICFDDQHIRNETSWGDLTTLAIFDLAAGRVAVVPGRDPQYVELSLADYRKLVTLRLSGVGLNDPDAKPVLTREPQTRQIGQWRCQLFVFEQAGRVPLRSELWVASDANLDFAAWVGLMERMGLVSALGRLGAFVGQIDGLPIETRTEQRVAGQRLVTTIRVLRIVAGVDEPGLFVLPEGHTRLEADPFPDDAGQAEDVSAEAQPVL